MGKWYLGVSSVFVAATLLLLAYSMDARAQVPCRQQCDIQHTQCIASCNGQGGNLLGCYHICDNNYYACIRSCSVAGEHENSLIKQQTADHCKKVAEMKGLKGSDLANSIKDCVKASQAAANPK